MDDIEWDEEEAGTMWWSDAIYFSGTCTCDHDEVEDHGWGSCDIDGCDCEAGWEE
jgi:hypothetical protein